jgi:hypothetical protein
MKEDIKVWLTFPSNYNGTTVILDKFSFGYLAQLWNCSDSAGVRERGLEFTLMECGPRQSGQNSGS